jgi:hypothetical protein
MTRHLLAIAVAAVCGALAAADDKKGTEVKAGGMTGTAPADWKGSEPTNEMRKAQFKLEKEKGDGEDADLVVFSLPGGGGIDANLKRQEAKFKLPDGVKKEDAIKVEDAKVGEYKGKYQDIKGTLLFKAAPFDPNAKTMEKEKFRQLYVIFEDADKATIAIVLTGPEKTVEKHKKAFDEFVKSFKK